AGRPVPAWPCSGWGLPSRPVARPLVSSYLTVSPLPLPPPAASRCGERGWRFVSVALSAGRPAWGLPSILPCGVRTFLDPPTRDEPEAPRPPGNLLQATSIGGGAKGAGQSNRSGEGFAGRYARPGPASHASTPAFANRSAFLLNSLGTCSKATLRNLLVMARTSPWRRISVGFLTRNRPESCSTSSRLSDRSRTSVAPFSAASRRPSSAAVYSATLFVATPIPSPFSATSRPSGPST